MSVSTAMTFLPNNASDFAILAAQNVLPSPVVPEVTCITFSPGFILSSMFARKARIASSIDSVDELSGMSATTGFVVIVSTSLRAPTLLRVICKRYSMPNGIHIPNMKATASTIAALGLTFPPSTISSISFPLSAVDAREIEFSSRLLSSIR